MTNNLVTNYTIIGLIVCAVIYTILAIYLIRKHKH